MSVGLGRGQRAHRVDEPPAGPDHRRRGGEQLALQRGQLVDRVRLDPPARLGPAAQHPEPGARRVEQHPVEARRRRTAARGRRPRPARPTPARAAPTARAHEAEPRPRCTSTATTSPRSSIASASAVAFPPGAAPTSSTRSPGCAPTAAATAWLAWSCGVARPSATAAIRAGSPPPRTTSASGAARRVRRSRPPRPARPRPSSAVARRGFTRSVSAAGSFAISSTARARRRGPRSATRRATIQSGIDVRIADRLDRVALGPRPGRAERRRPGAAPRST